MGKLIKILTSRLVWTLLLFLSEFVMLALLVYWAAYTKGFFLVFYLISMLVILIVLSRKENPSYKMVWIAIVSFVPVFGGVMYLLFGNKQIGRLSARKLLKYRNAENREVFLDDRISHSASIEATGEDQIKRLENYIYNTTLFPACQNTESMYFETGTEFRNDLLIKLENAKKFIFIEYFIIGEGRFLSDVRKILSKKAREGLDVRLIYDDMGSINSVSYRYDRDLEKDGIKTIKFNPLRLHVNPRLNFRDHRKIVVIDGDIGYTGGLNIADEYTNDEIRFSYWKDNAIRLSGSAVFSLTRLFLSMWDALKGIKEDVMLFRPGYLPPSDGVVQVFGSNPFADIPVGENAYIEMVNSARRYLWITTPYLIPDDTMINALKNASLGGVDVRIITPSVPDKKQVHEVSRSNYKNLIEAGVKIYEYTPGFIHTKMFLSDDNRAIVGTTNMDYRSFYLHFELSVLFYSSSMCKSVKEDFLAIMDVSKRMKRDSHEKINIIRRLFRYFYRMFSPAL